MNYCALMYHNKPTLYVYVYLLLIMACVWACNNVVLFRSAGHAQIFTAKGTLKRRQIFS